VEQYLPKIHVGSHEKQTFCHAVHSVSWQERGGKQ
jgi:hypothetical protein